MIAFHSTWPQKSEFLTTTPLFIFVMIARNSTLFLLEIEMPATPSQILLVNHIPEKVNRSN